MNGIRLGPQLTQGVKNIILANVALYGLIFISVLFTGNYIKSDFAYFLANIPVNVLEKGMVWQVFTYQFLHFDFWHIFFNMYLLWIFGSELEERWGRKTFYQFYLFTGSGAGLIILFVNYFFIDPNSATLGASGAIFGIMLAYAAYYPNRYILFMMIVPVKVKYLVLIYGLFSLMFTITGTDGNISHIGHLGGIIAGWVHLHYSMGIHVIKALNISQLDSAFESLKKGWYARKTAQTWDNRSKNFEHQSKEEIEQKVDELLDKISRQGIESLSWTEKNYLKWASKKMEGEDKEVH